MKQVLAYIIFFCLLVPAAYAQQKTVKKIKPYYVVIDDASFTNTKTDRGATLTGYYEKDSLVRLVAWFGYNYGDISREFFYWQDELIVANEIQRMYNPATTTPLDSIKPNFKARYLFTDGKLTDIQQKGSYSFAEMPSDKITQERTYLWLSEQYASALNEKRMDKANRMKMKKQKKPN